jgi:acyl-CoA hydrolase
MITQRGTNMSSPQRDITLRFLACSAGWSSRYCVTVYAGGIRFVSPIHVGNLVEVSAKIIYTGKSSMHIAIEVNACDPKSLNRRLTTHCIVIMVAVDESGQPVQVPTWIPKTDEDKEQHATAIKLMEMRKKIGEEMQIFV